MAFSRVGLIGHSAGGGVAQIETYSFDDVDALVILAGSFRASPKVLADFGQTGRGLRERRNPPGYAPLGSSKRSSKR